MTSTVLERINVKEDIHVVLAVYDKSGKYSQHAGVVMASIFENTQSPVCVHILHDATLTDENRRKFIRTAEKYGQRTAFIDMTGHVRNIGEEAVTIVSESFSHGSLFRLFIPEVMALDKVIYLDCDIIVNLDIKELWQTDMEGKCLAGVPDMKKSGFLFSTWGARSRLMGFDMKDYINSGVLLLDLQRIRLFGDMLKACILWFPEHSRHAHLPDQDFINSFFRGEIKHIPNKFNELNIYHSGEDAVLHLAGYRKPWSDINGLPREKLYWRMYLKTAWGEDKTAEDIAEILIDIMGSSEYLHRHTKQCYRQIAGRIWRDIFSNDFFKASWLYIKEGFYKIKKSKCSKKYKK